VCQLLGTLGLDNMDLRLVRRRGVSGAHPTRPPLQLLRLPCWLRRCNLCRIPALGNSRTPCHLLMMCLFTSELGMRVPTVYMLLAVLGWWVSLAGPLRSTKGQGNVQYMAHGSHGVRRLSHMLYKEALRTR
jgi:hypothetical protein